MPNEEIILNTVLPFLKSLGLDGEVAQSIAAQIERAINPTGPRLHSSMSCYEAQDWLAANDPAGAAYWRSQPPNTDMIAAVGEHLMLAKASRQLVFDREWHERYLRGDLP